MEIKSLAGVESCLYLRFEFEFGDDDDDDDDDEPNQKVSGPGVEKS